MASKQPYLDASASKDTDDVPAYQAGYESADHAPNVKDTSTSHQQAIGHPELPVYSASPNPPVDGRRLLHVYHKGWYHRKTTILDSDKVTPLYTIDANDGTVFSSKPHMKIYNASTNSIIGTVCFHWVSLSIDLEIHGTPVDFKRAGLFSYTHVFRSPSTGRTFSWKRDGFFSGGDLKCIDDKDQRCAGFECSSWAMKKDGKFELAPRVQGPLMDELVITGIAEVEFQKRQQNSSAGGGGGGG